MGSALGLETELQRLEDTNKELFTRLEEDLRHFYGQFINLTSAKSWYINTSGNDPIINVTGILRDVKLGDAGILFKLSATSDRKSALSEYGDYWWYMATNESRIYVVKFLDSKDRRELAEVSVIIKGFFKIMKRIDKLKDDTHS